MSKFENVTIVKEVNVYFEGKVTSRSVLFADGTKKTLGVMFPGEYEFGTDKKEIMEIMSGEMDVMLPDSSEWKNIKAGDVFEVPAACKFKVNVSSLTDYCCSYV